MKVLRRSAPARRRARRSGIVAAAAGVLLLIGLAMVGADITWAFVLLLVALATLFACLSHYLAMTELMSVGDVPVGELARPASILEPEMHPGEILGRLARAKGVDHHLVRHRDGWRVVASSVLVQQALAAREPVMVAELGRPAARVDSAVPVNQLRRPPFAGEMVVVGDQAPPRVITHDSLVLPATATIRRRSKGDDPIVERNINLGGEVQA